MRLVGGKLLPDDADDGPAIVDDDGGLSADLSCESCHRTFYHEKPGRKPRRCPDCREANRGNGTGSGGRRGTGRVEALYEPLLDRYWSLARVAGRFHPAYAVAIRENAEAAARADVDYAKVNPTFRKWLEKGLEKTAAMEVVAIHAEMLKPIAVGMGVHVVGPRAMRRQQRRQPPPPDAAPPRQQAARPANVTDLHAMPEEPTTQAQTVNAGAMPGMPA